jgi:hypothetical protein
MLKNPLELGMPLRPKVSCNCAVKVGPCLHPLIRTRRPSTAPPRTSIVLERCSVNLASQIGYPLLLAAQAVALCRSPVS